MPAKISERPKSSLLQPPVQIDVRQLLAPSAPFGPEQIELVGRAICGPQLTEVRQQLQELEQEFDRAPNNLLRMKVGVLSYLMGRHSVADEYLAKLSDNGLAVFNHGHVLVALGRYAEAAARYEQAEKLGHPVVDCRLARAGAIRAQGRLDEAEKLLQTAGPQGATKAEYSFQMGCILSDRGDTYGAVEYFERAVDMDPFHSRALFWLAGENNLRGNDEEAIRLYERSLSRPPLHLSALLNLGLLYEDVENFAAAAYCFRKVLEIYPNHPRARLYLKDIEAAHDMFYDEDIQRSQARLNQILEIPVTDFELSVRARNCLQKMGIRNLGDLTRITEGELLASKNFGDTSLDEIKTMLESKGLRLGQALEKEKPTRDYRLENLSPQEQALLTRPVTDLNLSVRARKCMTRLGITTLGELIQRTQDELLESKNFGVTSLNEVRSKLADLGLKLRGD